MNDLRLELRTRNNVLWHAIFDTYESVAAFCRAHDFEQSHVGALLNLRSSPYSRHHTRVGQLNAVARRLVEVTGIGGDELFPEALYRGVDVLPAKFVAEVESSRLISLEAATRRALLPAIDDGLIHDELRSALGDALQTLTVREERVLRERFGLDDQEPQTLSAIGDGLGICTERVREIEAKALRKLRHHSRARRLRAHLDAPLRAEVSLVDLQEPVDARIVSRT